MILRLEGVPEFPRCHLLLYDTAGEAFQRTSELREYAGYVTHSSVVALMGTSVSEAQEKLLLDRFPELILMLDGDEAGQRASQQWAERLRPRISLCLARLPPGRQPDQLSTDQIQQILRGAHTAHPGE